MKYSFIFGTVWGAMCLSGLQAQTCDLNHYLNKALSGAPLLKDYQNQVIINQIDSLILKAAHKPQVNFSANPYWSPMDSGNYDALLTLRQTIIGRKNINTQLYSYTLDNQSIQNAQQVSEQDLKCAVTQQYITTYGVLEELLFNRALKDLLQKEEVLVQRLTEASVYRQTDYLNFHITEQQQQLLVDQLYADYQNNIALLNYLCGEVDTSFVYLLPPDIALRPNLLFEETLQYSGFQIDSLVIINNNALIDYAYRPKLEIFSDAGLNSSFARQPYRHLGVGIGLSLSIPVYDGGQRQKEHSKLSVSEQTRNRYQDFSRQQYRQQIDQLHQQLSHLQKLIDQAREVVSSTRLLVEAYGKQLQTGDTSVTEYILAIGNYITAQHVITQNTNSKLQIINQINYWNHE
ncbi:MAG: TolC family protein [Bacteroidetes bacterium]|nr:TolC family protein [Bacteroidota bacterium]